MRTWWGEVGGLLGDLYESWLAALCFVFLLGYPLGRYTHHSCMNSIVLLPCQNGLIV